MSSSQGHVHAESTILLSTNDNIPHPSSASTEMKVQTISFLDLPAEIRIMVYHATFTHIDDTADMRYPLGRRFDLRSPIRQPLITLLSHSIQKESLPEFMASLSVCLQLGGGRPGIIPIHPYNAAWMRRAGVDARAIRRLSIRATISHPDSRVPGNRDIMPCYKRYFSWTYYTFKGREVFHGIKHGDLCRSSKAGASLISIFAQETARVLETLAKCSPTSLLGLEELEGLRRWMAQHPDYHWVPKDLYRSAQDG